MGRKKLYSSELYNACKKAFEAFHLKYHNVPFYYDTKNRCQLGEIINRLIISKNGVHTDDEIIRSFNYLLYNIDDKGYLWENLSPALIVSQWNDVLKQVRRNYRGKVVKNEEHLSDEFKKLPSYSRHNKQESISDLLTDIIK